MLLARFARASLPSLLRRAMAPPSNAYQASHGSTSAAAVMRANAKQRQHNQQQQQRNYTPTAMNRWSVLNKTLPPVNTISAIHVYDFDNTLFKTPLPNPKLWNGPTIGLLANPDVLNGGWWHDSRILSATGGGILKEEPRGWEGWWNEKVVELVQLSMRQKDALTVLLTGRSESGFADLVKRMAASRGLEFDMVSLKPTVGPDGQRFASTMNFKQIFLGALMETFKEAKEIRVYEDRPKHVKGFRDFMTEYNVRLNEIVAAAGNGGPPPNRQPITSEVIHVAELGTNLDPVIEVAEVQHLINAHNAQVVSNRGGHRREKLAIKKTVFYTGYLISSDDTSRLLTLVAPQLPRASESDLKVHANNIMICPRPCPHSIMEKVGGMGSKMKWEVVGLGCFENSVWAASVRPVPSTAKYHTDNKTPHIVLALRKGARPIDASKIQNWQPLSPDQAFIFETTVGEKILFRIEADDPSEGEYESLFANKSSKRKHTVEDEAPSYARGGGNFQGKRNFHSQAGNARGGGGRGNGNGGFRGNSGRGNRGNSRGGGFRGNGGGGGRGGKHSYHSLDDPGKQRDGGGGGGMSYEDSSYTAPSQQQQHQHQHQNAPQQPTSQQQQPYTHYQPPQPMLPPPPLVPSSAYYSQAPQAAPAWQPSASGPPGGGGGGGYGGLDMGNYY